MTLDEWLYEQAKAEADRLQVSRSKLIATALRDYLERRRTDEILAALDDNYGDGLAPDEMQYLRGASAALRRIAEGER